MGGCRYQVQFYVICAYFPVLYIHPHFITSCVFDSMDMLRISSEREESQGDIFCLDMGAGLPFRAGIFDGCISISALQWLCYSDKKEHTARYRGGSERAYWRAFLLPPQLTHFCIHYRRRLHAFFSSLYTCLKRGSRAVFQFYPETPEQMELISSSAMRVGFSGGVVIDYPNSSKARKYYLCLFAGCDPSGSALPSGLGVNAGGGSGASSVSVAGRSSQAKGSSKGRTKKLAFKGRQWILEKKERQRHQGRLVRPDSKYSGRKRPDKF